MTVTYLRAEPQAQQFNEEFPNAVANAVSDLVRLIVKVFADFILAIQKLFHNLSEPVRTPIETNYDPAFNFRVRAWVHNVQDWGTSVSDTLQASLESHEPRPQEAPASPDTVFKASSAFVPDDTEKQECAICLMDIEHKEALLSHTANTSTNDAKDKTKKKVEHAFHKACLEKCFKRKHECPICRATAVIK